MITAFPQPLSAAKRSLHSLKVDMTPMVDLGFLLITFFIFTTTLTQPGITKLVMPAKGASIAIPQSKTLTVLINKNKVFVYEGLWSDAVATKKIATSDYSFQNGMGTFIRQKQNKLLVKDDLVVLIKPLTTASYQNIITALDEMQINRAQKYAVVEASEDEKAFVQTQ